MDFWGPATPLTPSPLSTSPLPTPPYLPIRTGELETYVSDDSSSDEELLVTPFVPDEDMDARIERLETDLARFMEHMEAMRARLRELLEM